MTRAQVWTLFFLVAATAASFWWFSERSTGWKNYRWFQRQIQIQTQQNTKLSRTNKQMRRETMALRYDHRLIEREARDLLTLTREGEIVVNLPR